MRAMEDPQLAEKLVRREVTRVVTPGTAADSSLNSEENNFLAAVAQSEGRAGFAALDLSTGEFRATEFQGEDAQARIQEELQQLRPKEVLYGFAAPLFAARTSEFVRTSRGFPRLHWTIGFSPPTMLSRCSRIISESYPSRLRACGKTRGRIGCGSDLYYVRSTQRGTLNHVDRVGFYERQIA